MDIQRPLCRKFSIDVNLHDVSALLLEANVGKKRHVVRISIVLDRKPGGNGYDKVLWALLALSPILGTIAARSDPDVEESWA